MRRAVLLLPLLLLSWLLLPAASPARAQTLTVFAAASLTDVMRDVAKAWEAKGGAQLRLNLAGSSVLARQLQQGAVANLFASADLQWMDWAQKQHLIVDSTRRNLLGNSLVLVAPREQAKPVEIKPGFDLLALLGPHGRLAVGDPSNVPAGIYAKDALTALGLWQSVSPHLAAAENVRAALLLVERGEAPLGIVYATDAAVAPGVAVVGTFPPDTHPPITYPFAIPRSGDTQAAHVLLDFVSGPQAAALFRQRGFTTSTSP